MLHFIKKILYGKDYLVNNDLQAAHVLLKLVDQYTVTSHDNHTPVQCCGTGTGTVTRGTTTFCLSGTGTVGYLQT